MIARVVDAEKKVYVARLLHKSPADPSHRVSMRADECQICLGAGVSPDVLFLPCGHLAACSACELSWLVTMLNQRIGTFLSNHCSICLFLRFFPTFQRDLPYKRFVLRAKL